MATSTEERPTLDYTQWSVRRQQLTVPPYQELVYDNEEYGGGGYETLVQKRLYHGCVMRCDTFQEHQLCFCSVIDGGMKIAHIQGPEYVRLLRAGSVNSS